MKISRKKIPRGSFLLATSFAAIFVFHTNINYKNQQSLFITLDNIRYPYYGYFDVKMQKENKQCAQFLRQNIWRKPTVGN